MSPENGPVGAWGLRLSGPCIDSGALNAVPTDWPEVRVSVTTGRVSGEPHFDERTARIGLYGGGMVELDRAAGTSDLFLPEPPSREAVIHPHLASTAVIANHWLGRASVHAGAFVADGAACALLGDRTSGKSSTLGLLWAAGMGIVTDDVLTFDGATAYAGPRCMDLREEAAHRLGAGRHLGLVGSRHRWRVDLAPVPPAVPLRNLVLLAWDERISVERVRPADVLPELFGALAFNSAPDPRVVLDLAAVPAWRWRRPQSWSSAQEACDALIEAISN